MTSLWEDGGVHASVEMGLGCNLKSLAINGCERLERLPNGWHLVLTCLEQLKIYGCPKLVSFPDHGFPPMLRDVSLVNCEGLKHLPDGTMMMITGNSNNINFSSRLERLEIRECPSLTCFPKGQLPTTLKRLTIVACEKLDSLPDGMMMCYSNNTSTGPGEEDIYCSQLEALMITKCPSLTCFPKGSLPTTLKVLHISYCEKLESLPEGIMQQHQYSINIPSLEILELEECSSLTSFPKGSFPSTLRQLELVDNPQLESISGEIFFHHYHSLQRLYIWSDCNLRTLPADSLYNLTQLKIIDCQNLELRPNQFENLTRLTSLEIFHCRNIKRPLSQWGLANLPSLQSLEIKALFPDVDIFSDTSDHHHQCYSNNRPILPPTLTSLIIGGFEKLESLASLSLQTLTSLRRLDIVYCPKLRSILPREGVLPHSLGRLEFRECPLLKESYSREKGENWPLLAHIPRVDI